MFQDDEDLLKPALPIPQSDVNREEIHTLVQRAAALRRATPTDPMNDLNNLKDAIDLYKRALDRADPDSGEAAEIRSLLVQVIAEQQQKLLIQQLSTTNLSVHMDRQTLNTLLDNLQNLGMLERRNTQAIQEVSSIQSRELEIVRKEEDLEKEKQKIVPLLAIENFLIKGSEKVAQSLIFLFKPLLYLTLFALVFSFFAPALLNWYFNSNPLKLCASGKITISTSSVLQPLLLAEAQKYQQACSDAAIAVVSSSPNGIAYVDADPAISIGTAETSAYTTQHQLWDDQVAITIFTMVVNKQAGVSNLTTENVREIYSGSVGNWKDVCSSNSKKVLHCGNDLNINIIGRPVNSDVRAIFEQHVLQRAEYIPGSIVSDLDTSSQGNGIVQYISSTPGAIGYVSLSAALRAHLSPLSLDGVTPTLASVSNQTYPFWSTEHLYTRGPASGLGQKFLYFLHTDDAISLLHQYGFQSINDVSTDVVRNHS